MTSTIENHCQSPELDSNQRPAHYESPSRQPPPPAIPGAWRRLASIVVIGFTSCLLAGCFENRRYKSAAECGTVCGRLGVERFNADEGWCRCKESPIECVVVDDRRTDTTLEPTR